MWCSSLDAKCTISFLFYTSLVLFNLRPISAESFTLGYLTGSQRQTGNYEYDRPGKCANVNWVYLFGGLIPYNCYSSLGLMISGAISLAVSEVNAGALHTELGHELSFVVAETRGEEISSIRQTASLWTDRIYGYIGPQETCVHEGRMAAAFNIPMISYVSSFEFCGTGRRVFLQRFKNSWNRSINPWNCMPSMPRWRRLTSTH